MPLQFVRPADQHAAVLLSGRLADLRKKEQLRQLFAAEQVLGSGPDLAVLAEKFAPIVGMDVDTVLACLIEFSAGKC